MFSKIAKNSAFAALISMAALVGAVDFGALDYHGRYFSQISGHPLVVERLDPVMSPGGVSGHVHSIIGSNAFAPTMDFALTQTATCSTVRVTADKSSYWTPSLYFQHPKNGSFIRVEEAYQKIYYLNKAEGDQTIEEFPKEFRMIAGNPFQRVQGEGKFKDISHFDCHNPDVYGHGMGFPKGITGCNNGFAATLHFPHCWNGNAFDINNPYDHMAYPEGISIEAGRCPDSHPHVLPHIFIEFWFEIEKFNGMYTANDNPWVLSQGDPTSFGFHGDFINGWEPGTLLNAMQNCNIGGSGDPLANCGPGFVERTDAELKGCVQAPAISEVIDGWLDALPGCNPIQYGPNNATQQTCSGDDVTLGRSGSNSAGGSASAVSSAANGASSTPAAVLTLSTVAKGVAAPTSAAAVSDMEPSPTDAAPTAMSAPADAPSVAASSAAAMPAAPSALASNSSAPSVNGLPSGWTSAGCYTDALNPRSLSGITFAWFQEKITSTGCAKYCDAQGYSIAGTENGGQCFCGNELTDSGPAGDSVCSIPCKGDAKQTCGGKAALSIFTKGSVSLPSGDSSKMFVRGVRQN